jgi:hypothetical protein
MSTLSPEDPDYELELFWSTYKCSLENFYKSYKQFTRPLKYWYDDLNFHKRKNNYDKIQKKIFDYLTLHMIDVIKSMDAYHSQILKTNFNRYIKLCEKVKFYDFVDEIIRLDVIFRIYYSIVSKKSFSIIEMQIFSQIELFIFYDDFNLLIKYALDNNSANILDNLMKITNIHHYIEAFYDVELDSYIKGKKIIQLIKNKIEN